MESNRENKPKPYARMFFVWDILRVLLWMFVLGFFGVIVTMAVLGIK